jgi:hypothetical protein
MPHMEKRKLWMGILVITLVFGTMLISCPTEPDEPTYPSKPTTYTVWTDSVSYSEFQNTVGALNDGYYRKFELTNSEFNSMSSLPNEYKHNWTEEQIYNWFIGRDFISSEANQLKAWVITTNHCFIASRSGGTVYILIK